MKKRYQLLCAALGLAYRLTEKTVIRAGFGTSYTPFADNTYAYNYPVRANNFYTNVGDGFAGTLLPSGQPATFQQGFPLPVPVTIPSNGIIPATGSAVEPQQIHDQPEFQEPLRRELESRSATLAAGALDSGRGLRRAARGGHGAQWNLNAPTSVLGGGTASEPLDILYGKTAGDTLYWDGFSSSYNALQAKLDRRFGDLNMPHCLHLGQGYGITRAATTAPCFGYIDARRDYARTDFDRSFELQCRATSTSCRSAWARRWLSRRSGSRDSGQLAASQAC